MIDIQLLKNTIRDVPDFPKEGIIFKDITPVLLQPALCNAIIDEIKNQVKDIEIDVVAGVESRGFLFGMLLANALQLPFVPIRKVGKLPYKTQRQKYDLEYGTAEIEVHLDAFLPQQKVLLHDDLLATGGTIQAAAQLVQALEAQVAAFSFIISLDFLQGEDVLQKYNAPILSVLRY